MRTKTSVVAYTFTGVGAVLYATWWLVEFLGKLQGIKGWFDDRGAIMKMIGSVATQPYFHLGLFLVGVLLLILLRSGLVGSLMSRWKPVLTLAISGVVLSDVVDSGTRFQMTVTIRNRGASTTLHDWHLSLCSDKSVQILPQLVGQEPAKGSLALDPLESFGMNQLGQGGEIAGFLWFLLPGESHASFVRLLKSPGPPLVLELSVQDKNNGEWHTHRDFRELAAERLREVPLE